MPGKPRLKEARVLSENEDNYTIEIIFDNGHKAPLDVLKDENIRFSAPDRISENYIYRNLFGLHHYKREPEEEKENARKVIDDAINEYKKN